MVKLLAAAAVLGVAAADCADLTDCGSCIDYSGGLGKDCHWCDVDQRCHVTGGQESACSSSLENDRCVSQSWLTACDSNKCREASEALRPSQVHFALAGATGLRVAWKTDALPAACSLAVTLGGETSTVSATRQQYLVNHGHHHVATVDGLTPGASYAFHAECDGAASDTLSFQVPRADLEEAHFLVTGDMGWSEFAGAEPSRKRMEALVDAVDLTLHVGDVGYADDSFLHSSCRVSFCYEAVYDKYMMWMKKVFDSKPYMVTPGNHEAECHSPNCLANTGHKDSLRNFSAYNARWQMPSQESGGALSMWYSFDYGPVHFVSLNTETDFPDAAEGEIGVPIIGGKSGHFGADGEYLRWLEADLQAADANRAERPWIVAMGHRAWIHKESESIDVAVGNAHKPLFDKYGVDLYLAGHWHAYSRHVPVEGGTVVVITGAAGCDEGLEGWEITSGSNKNGYDYYSNGITYQVGTLDATRESLVWKAHSSETGEVFDTHTISKEAAVSV